MEQNDIPKNKVGILTLHYTYNNYGAVLQAFSIYKLIESMGYESYLINYQPLHPTFKGKLFSFLQKSFGREFSRFRCKYIKRSLNVGKGIEELNKLNSILDAFVVGSDQVWRLRQDIRILYAYFLDFVDDEKIKLSYGASFGLDSWNGNETTTNHVKNLLKRFKAISVREASGLDICKNVFDSDCSLVLDPTLVLDNKYFHAMSDSAPSSRVKHRYLAYFLFDPSDDSKALLYDIAQKNNLHLVNLMGTPVVAKKHFYIFNSIETWLNLIKYADLVITDSFHCTVFSIIFHKLFACLPNTQRGTTRLHNLLNLIGERPRLLDNPGDLNDRRIFDTIDYQKIDQILENDKSYSIAFLRDNLHC